MPQSSPYEFRYTIGLHDTDAAGVLFSANLITICHLAYESMMAEAGFSMGSILAHGRFGLPLAHVEGDFQKRLTASDDVVIRLRVAELGKASFRLSYEVVNRAGDVCATASTTHVCVETESYRPRPLPDELREALTAYV